MPRGIYKVQTDHGVYDVEADSEAEAIAAVQSDLKPGTGGAVYGDTQQPVTAGQERALQAMGGINSAVPVGAGNNPRFQAPGGPAPDTGTYIDPRGQTMQHDARPLSETLGATIGRAGLRAIPGMNVVAPSLASRLFPSGANDAAESGFASGMLLGGKNELGAIPEGLSSLVRGQGFSAGFDPAVDVADARDATLRGNHPYAYYGAGSVGTAGSAILAPELKGAGALVKGANIALDTGTAALGGALSSDRGQRAQGAMLGAGLALPLSRAMRGRVFGGKGAPARLTPLVESIPEAERAAAAARLRRIAPKKGVPDLGPDFMAAEALGPAGVRELGTLARREGDTAAAVEARLLQRRDGRPNRLLNAFEQSAGIAPDAAAGNLDAMLREGRAAARPLYDSAFANQSPMASPTMDRLLARDAAKRGMNQARKIMSNEDVNPYTQGLTFMDNPDEWASQAGGLFPDATPAAEPASAAGVVRRGDSLVTFLSKRGGLNDAGGELAGRDGDIWHRNLPFRRKLTSPNGLDMGDAAQRALDAGYFPELGRDGTLTGNDLLAAVEDELRGRPRFARELTGQDEASLAMRDAESRWGPQGQDLGGDMPEYGARPEPVGGPVYEQQPTTQGVDYVIRGLDTELENRKVNGVLPNDALTQSILDTRKQLRSELNRLAKDENRNPDYVAAVQQAGDYLGAQDAFRTAQKDLFNSSLPARDFAAKVEKMSPSERKYAAAGASNAVWNLAQKGALRPKSWPPHVNAKLRSLLGDDAVDSLDRVFANESMMANTERADPSGNGSGTFGWGETARDQDRSFLADLARNSAVGFVAAGPMGAKAGALATIGGRLGQMIPGGMRVPARDALGRVLQGSSEDARALLSVPRRAPVRKALEDAGKVKGIRKGVPRVVGVASGRN
jgi:hypothetical protein